MATYTTHQSKHQWQSKHPDKFRVRLFRKEIHLSSAVKFNANEIFWQVANEFKSTPVYRWVEDNSIDLKWEEDDHIASWHKLCLLYADLTQPQYVDYVLRFFDHHNEDWK